MQAAVWREPGCSKRLLFFTWSTQSGTVSVEAMAEGTTPPGDSVPNSDTQPPPATTTTAPPNALQLATQLIQVLQQPTAAGTSRPSQPGQICSLWQTFSPLGTSVTLPKRWLPEARQQRRAAKCSEPISWGHYK